MMDRIIEYLDSNQDRFVSELKEYVSIPSVSTDPKYTSEMTRCAEWLAEHFKKIGVNSAVHSTDGHPVVLAKTYSTNIPPKGKPHFLIYGHYDVQPPDPIEQWESPPFEATIKDGCLYGRGTADNKGQHFAHIKAIEAYYKTNTELPCELTFVIEGEEETGSQNFAKWLRRNKASLQCDAIIISDTSMPAVDKPALTYGIRGLINFEVSIRGPSSDLHSGVYGGVVDNPAMVLCRILAGVHDHNGKIRIPGFYDNVQPLTRAERRIIAQAALSESTFKKLLGVPNLGGEKNFSPEERRTVRPTFEINGIWSGYTGPGSKTVIPSIATAKISCRLVPDQDPKHVYNAVKKFIESLCPNTVKLQFQYGAGCSAYKLDPKNPLALAALDAIQQAFGKKPALIREGGSIPVVSEMTKLLKAEAIMVGLALPDAHIHAPNERLNLTCFQKGQLLGALLWERLSKAIRSNPSNAGRKH